MRSLGLSLLAAGMLAGCTHSMVMTSKPQQREVVRASQLASDWSGTVETQSGELHRGHHFRLTPDTLHWFDPEPELNETMRQLGYRIEPPQHRALPLVQVSEIRTKNNQRGLRDGLAFGIMGGIIVGMLWENDVRRTDEDFFAELHQNAPERIVLCGAAFGIAGSVVGSLLGSPNIIRIQSASGEAVP